MSAAPRIGCRSAYLGDLVYHTDRNRSFLANIGGKVELVELELQAL